MRSHFGKVWVSAMMNQICKIGKGKSTAIPLMAVGKEGISIV